jgi:hypothetical protein
MHVHRSVRVPVADAAWIGLVPVTAFYVLMLFGSPLRGALLALVVARAVALLVVVGLLRAKVRRGRISDAAAFGTALMVVVVCAASSYYLFSLAEPSTPGEGGLFVVCLATTVGYGVAWLARRPVLAER